MVLFLAIPRAEAAWQQFSDRTAVTGKHVADGAQPFVLQVKSRSKLKRGGKKNRPKARPGRNRDKGKIKKVTKVRKRKVEKIHKRGKGKIKKVTTVRKVVRKRKVEKIHKRGKGRIKKVTKVRKVVRKRKVVKIHKRGKGKIKKVTKVRKVVRKRKVVIVHKRKKRKKHDHPDQNVGYPTNEFQVASHDSHDPDVNLRCVKLGSKQRIHKAIYPIRRHHRGSCPLGYERLRLQDRGWRASLPDRSSKHVYKLKFGSDGIRLLPSK